MIDVIIPVFNVQNYLVQCLESFVSQFDGSFTIILIDDGSQDSSGQICEEYAGKYSFIRAFHKENGGLSSARNYGLDRTNGDYIFFFDSDDFLASGSITRINELVRNGTDLIFLEDMRFSEEGQKPKYIPSKINEKILKEGRKEEILLHLLSRKRMRTSAWSMILRRDAFKKQDLLFKEGIAMEDVEWSPRIILGAKTYSLLKGPVYVYRIRGDSLSHSKLSTWKTQSFINILKENAKPAPKSIDEVYINGFLANFYLQFIYLFSKQKKLKDINEEFRHFSWIVKYGRNLRCRFSQMVLRLFGINVLFFCFKLL